MSHHVRLFVVGALATLAPAGCATGYGAQGLTGGYSDSRINDTHYVVQFNGNGFASKERVWNFWFYRCAELVTEKGFAYFDIEPAKGKKQSFLEDPTGASRYAGLRTPERTGLVMPAIFVFVPGGGAAVTWNSAAVVAMFKDIPKGKLLFSARRVLELLNPYVKSNGSGSPPDRKVLLRGAVVRLGSNGIAERVFPDGAKIGYINTKRLFSTADGKVALAALRATFNKKTAEFDAAKAELSKRRVELDAQSAGARRSAMEAEFNAKKKELQQLYEKYQAEIAADEEKAVRQFMNRARPFVERIQSEQELDAVTEEAAGGLWDVDITDQVIRLYEEKYPVPAAA
jgi:Skp family chaperone for outer membrane proteins